MPWMFPRQFEKKFVFVRLTAKFQIIVHWIKVLFLIVVINQYVSPFSIKNVFTTGIITHYNGLH
jgi:hypothetical protein